MGHPNVFYYSHNGQTRGKCICNFFNAWDIVCHIGNFKGGIIYLAYSLKGVSPGRAWKSGTV